MEGLCGIECSKCILKDSCGGCSLCEAALCSNKCNSCCALCKKRPGAVELIRRIDVINIVEGANKEYILPYHIPIVPDRLRDDFDCSLIPIMAVHAGNMFSRNGEKINKSYLENGYAAALNINHECEALLEFYVKDRTLEGFWDKRNNICKDLKTMRFKAVIAPNFSVYEDASRIDHIYNMKRTMVVYKELLDQGIDSIPDVSWFNKNDLDRWINLINLNNIKTIAFSFQVVDIKLKASNIYRSYLSGFKYLCGNISSDVKIIVIGASSYKRAVEIKGVTCGQSIHVLNQSAFVQSRRAIISENRERDIDKPFDAIFEQNLKYFSKIYEEINKEDEYSEVCGCQRLEEVIQ